MLILTAGDMAIHGIDYDRGFEGLGPSVGGNGGSIGSRLVCRYAGGSLRFPGRFRTGSPWSFLFSEVIFQPFGWKTHDGIELTEEGKGRKRLEVRVENSEGSV